MEINEFRVGNLVVINNKITKIDKDILNDILNNKIEVNKLELTDDRLMDYGFVIKGSYYVKYPLQLTEFPGKGICYFHEQFGGFVIKINYVHELQNLYLILSKQELL